MDEWWLHRCVGRRWDEWHVDLHKSKGGSDIGKAGLAWEDGGWQPSHHRQGGPRCVMLIEVPFGISSTSSDSSSFRTATCPSPTSSPRRSSRKRWPPSPA